MFEDPKFNSRALAVTVGTFLVIYFVVLLV
jgi:hypothetical protein